MANPITSIQSLKAVDAWIDVINANINGGVRTAFKASRLRFAGSNTTIDRAPTATSLPLQLPEPSLLTANTVIDWSQGAVTSSTEDTHLALQGEGFFKLRRFEDDPDDPATQYYYSRDGEFHWMVLPAGRIIGLPNPTFGVPTTDPYAIDPGNPRAFLVNSQGLAVVDGDNELVGYRLNNLTDPNTGFANDIRNYAATGFVNALKVVKFDSPQQLQYSRYGSTVFTFTPGTLTETVVTTSETTRLQKSLEASNSSMTQSVPELSLAQKLFSALTKVLQIHQTNQDAVLNTIR